MTREDQHSVRLDPFPGLIDGCTNDAGSALSEQKRSHRGDFAGFGQPAQCVHVQTFSRHCVEHTTFVEIARA
jgi:hypothetical protein